MPMFLELIESNAAPGNAHTGPLNDGGSCGWTVIQKQLDDGHARRGGDDVAPALSGTGQIWGLNTGCHALNDAAVFFQLATANRSPAIE